MRLKEVEEVKEKTTRLHMPEAEENNQSPVSSGRGGRRWRKIQNPHTHKEAVKKPSEFQSCKKNHVP